MPLSNPSYPQACGGESAMNVRRREGAKMERVQAYWERQLRIHGAIALGTLCLVIATSFAIPAAVGPTLFSPYDALNLAIAEMIRREPAKARSLMAETNWEMQDLTPELLGASALQYVGKAWSITVSYPVVFQPAYTVEIQYNGANGLIWRLSVDQAGRVIEL